MRMLSAIPTVVLLVTASIALRTMAGVSNTYIGAGKIFMLGGQQRASMTIKGQNISSSQIEVLLLSGRKERLIATIEPNKSFSLGLPARYTALFRNRASRTASVTLEMTNAVSQLSMGYENGDDSL
jgi:hypothetical protein